ncbi:hypothetical protein JCM3766R1_004629, partial [Sporobolomyces carnicolor]
ITYLAIIVVAGVVVALVSSRYFYIRRYYAKPTLRAYFLPKGGVHIKWLRIHIKGAPNRTLLTEMTTLDQVYGASAGQRGGERRRRRRRNRQTVGETLGPGGVRIGDGDDDDGWDDDYDNFDLESGGGGNRDRTGQRGELPAYQHDSGLPAYVGPANGLATTNAGTSQSGHASGGGAADEVDALPSAAEYEALSRAGRDGASGLPTYPPPVHVHGANTLYPAEPPPSFSRANSAVSNRQPAVHDASNDSRSTFETTADDEDGLHERRDIARRIREEDRRQSTATASSSDSIKSDLRDGGEGHRERTATGSKVTLGSSSSSADSTHHEKSPEGKEQ